MGKSLQLFGVLKPRLSQGAARFGGSLGCHIDRRDTDAAGEHAAAEHVARPALSSLAVPMATNPTSAVRPCQQSCNSSSRPTR